MYWTRTLDHVWYTAGEEGGREGGRGRLREGGRKGEGEMVRGRGGERKIEREREKRERCGGKD